MGLGSIFGEGLASTINAVGNVIDKFVTTDKEKGDIKIEIEKVLIERDKLIQASLMAELSAKEKIIVAEMSQGDAFTKRARPMVVYVGLSVIVYNYCIVPTILAFMQFPMVQFDLPVAFWTGWSGIVMTWSVGRSMEKKGSGNKLTSMVTGSKLF